MTCDANHENTPGCKSGQFGDSSIIIEFSPLAPKALAKPVWPLQNRIMRSKSPRVLLALGWYDHRVHQGIANYAQQHGWHLSVDVTKEKVIPWGWQGDGI